MHTCIHTRCILTVPQDVSLCSVDVDVGGGGTNTQSGRRAGRANMAVKALVHLTACLHVVTHSPDREGRRTTPELCFSMTSQASQHRRDSICLSG